MFNPVRKPVLAPAARQFIAVLAWTSLVVVVTVPIIIAAFSPLQAGRNTSYIVGEMSGIVALALLLMQPLLAASYLPGTNLTQGRKWHRWIGSAIVIGVFLHIGGLYLTSPDDMTDALLLVAPTPFSVYGVVGPWSIILTAILVTFRTKLRISYKTWSILHNALAVIVVVASVVHALMIEGVMGEQSKIILSACILASTAITVLHLRVLRPLLKKRRLLKVSEQVNRE